MKNLENIPEAIFDLLAQKQYSELSVSEKAAIDAVMSEVDYKSYQAIIQDFQSLDEALLLEKPKLTPTKKKESIMRKILNYPVPLYQVAAVFLLFTFATFAISDFGKKGDLENTVKVEESKNGVGKSLANDEYPEELVFNF